MARTDPQLNIRIPSALKDALDQVADKNNRSTTAEIIRRLQSSFEEPSAEIQFSRGDDASDAMLANMRKLRQEGEAKDETIGSLQREIEHLQARLKASSQITNLVEATQAILATALRNAIDRMPEQLQKEHATIHQLANSIVHGDARGMGSAFARILEADPDKDKGAQEAAGLRQFMTEMEPAIAAKERGEDLKPYQKADFDKMRDRLEEASRKSE